MAQRFASKLATKNGSNGAVECLVLNKAEENARKPAFVARDQLKNSKRVVIKMGSAVITREDGKGLYFFQIFKFQFKSIYLETT